MHANVNGATLLPFGHENNNHISHDHVVPCSETRMSTNVNMHRGRSEAMFDLRAQRILIGCCVSRRTVVSVLCFASRMRANVNVDLQAVWMGNWYCVVTRFP